MYYHNKYIVNLQFVTVLHMLHLAYMDWWCLSSVNIILLTGKRFKFILSVDPMI